MTFRIIALVVLLTAGAAWAQQTRPGAAPDSSAPKAEKQVKRLYGDANKDGVLTRAEYLDHAAKRFDDIDADADGGITAEEQAAYDDARRAARQKKSAEKKEKHEASEPAGFLNRFFN